MSTQASRLSADLSFLAAALMEGGAVRHSLNFLTATVTLYHPPGPAGLPPVPWPASVDCQSLPAINRRLEAPGEIRPGEVPTGTDTVTLPFPLAQRIPVFWPGVPGLTLTEPLLPGTFGLILVAGKHLADTMSTGAPGVPELPPNVLRLSDAVFLPCAAMPGVLAALAPQIQEGSAPQLSPASALAATVFLRLLGSAWTLAGSQINLGDGAVLGVARSTDPVIAAPDLVAYMTALEASLAGIGVVVATPFASLFSGAGPVGTIGPASTVTRSL